MIDEMTRQDILTYLDQHTIYALVDTSKMFVAKYSRPLQVAKVQAMARQFDERAIGTILLSLRTGEEKYAILDGQHRIAAANLKGIRQLPARVFIDLSYEDEAALYVRFATVNQQSPLDRFKARVEAKDPLALDILEILQSTGGLYISYSGQHDHGIQAITVLESLYKKGGRAHLRHVLTTIYRTWQGAPRAYTHPILQGLSAFLTRYEQLDEKEDGVKLDWQRLVQTLGHLTPEALIAKASTLRGILGQVSANNDSVGQVILLEYNKGLKTKRLPEWVRQPKKGN